MAGTLLTLVHASVYSQLREAPSLAVHTQQAVGSGTHCGGTCASNGATTARSLVSTASMIGGFRNFAGTARAR